MNDPTALALAGYLERWNQRSINPFIERFTCLDDTAWQSKLQSSIAEPDQDGISFPRLPSVEMQNHIHGNADKEALNEAFAFYRVVRGFAEGLNTPIGPNTRLLDFGCGWGRMLRPFMARIELRNLYGYEPQPLFCQVARVLNPYVTFVCGGFQPPTVFGGEKFDVILSWSVFTHLPPELVRQWMNEFARIMPRGGLLFTTVWGSRFIDLLFKSRQQQRVGEPIHWFHKQVLDSVGDLAALRSRHQAGETIFVPSSVDSNYGETIMSPRAAEQVNVTDFELVAYDNRSLPQDLMVYRRL